MSVRVQTEQGVHDIRFSESHFSELRFSEAEFIGADLSLSLSLTLPRKGPNQHSWLTVAASQKVDVVGKAKVCLPQRW